MTFLAEPCEAGYLLDPTDGCQPCPMDEYSAAGNEAATCTKCPEGKGVASGEGTQDSDCKWSKLLKLIFLIIFDTVLLISLPHSHSK